MYVSLVAALVLVATAVAPALSAPLGYVVFPHNLAISADFCVVFTVSPTLPGMNSDLPPVRTQVPTTMSIGRLRKTVQGQKILLNCSTILIQTIDG
jgi:hypothetical protein